MIILITYHQTIGLPFILLMNNLYVWSAAHGCGPGYIVNKSWHQSPNASSDAHCFLRQAEPDNGEQIALNVHPAQAEATLPIRSELHLFCLEPGMWLTSWVTSSSTTTRLRPPCLSHLLIQLLLAPMSLPWKVLRLDCRETKNGKLEENSVHLAFCVVSKIRSRCVKNILIQMNLAFEGEVAQSN